MRLRHIAATALVCTAMLSCIDTRASEKPVDVLDYLLQKDDREMAWTIGGTDVLPGIDPEGAEAKTCVLTKFSSPNCYEVFRGTNTDILIRYEVFRTSGAEGKGNWIRRFEEIGGRGGAVWAKRFMVPSGSGFVSRYRQDRLAFDEGTKSYVFTKDGSAQELQTYVSVVWAQIDWGKNNQTGLDLGKVLRLISEWQTEGKILETYDYAKGKGLVSWRWLERISTLPPADGDTTGRVFRCENGLVYVEPASTADGEPVVWKYDMASGKKDRRLEVVRFTSHWRPKLGPQWYVVYRDLAKEGPLVKRNERIVPDYSLPEWQSRPGSTIADLPHVFTHRAH